MSPMAMRAQSVKRKPGEASRPGRDLFAPAPNAATPPLLETEVSGAELVHQFEDSSSAACDAGQRIVGDDDRETGFFSEELVDVAQQRTTAREDDAALCHICAELRWCL